MPVAMSVAKKIASTLAARLRLASGRNATLSSNVPSGSNRTSEQQRVVALENHLTKSLGVTFADRALLWDTGIFPETDAAARFPRPKNIEFSRLEFLGDSTLSLSLRMLMLRDMPNADTGDLTPVFNQYASNGHLAQRFSDLELDHYAFKTAKIDRLDYAQAVEALLGGVYLDKGFHAVLEFVEQHLYVPHNAAVDPIGALLRLASKKGVTVELNETPTSEGNNGLNPSFEFECLRNGKSLCFGKGGTKKSARAECAKLALQTLSYSDGDNDDDDDDDVRPYAGASANDGETNNNSKLGGTGVGADEWALHFDPNDPSDVKERNKLYGSYVSFFLLENGELDLIETKGEGTHQPRFKFAANFNGKTIAVGVGETKKAAKGVAAKLAIHAL